VPAPVQRASERRGVAGRRLGTCSSPLGLVCDPTTATVGAGTEFALWFGNPGGPNSVIDFLVDVAASSITLTVALPGGLNLGLLTSTTTFGSLDSSAGDIVGVSLATSSVAGVDSSDLSFTAHSVSIDINGIWNAGGSAVISLTFANSPCSSPVNPAALRLGRHRCRGGARVEALADRLEVAMGATLQQRGGTLRWGGAERRHFIRAR